MAISKALRAAASIFVVSSLSFLACGCVELKYSAANRLGGPVGIRTSSEPASVYISLRGGRGADSDSRVKFISSALSSALQKRGLAVREAQNDADIAINGKCNFYRKAEGTFLLILICPVYRFTEDFDGIALVLTYKTSHGKWRKTYRVYYRGWLEGEFETAVDTLTNAVVGDLPIHANPVSQPQLNILN